MSIFNIYCDESCHLPNDGQTIMTLGLIWCPLDKTREIFDKNYLEKGMNGTMLMSAVPCHFLKEN